jgi:hypothetical protein
VVAFATTYPLPSVLHIDRGTTKWLTPRAGGMKTGDEDRALINQAIIQDPNIDGSHRPTGYITNHKSLHHRILYLQIQVTIKRGTM